MRRAQVAFHLQVLVLCAAVGEARAAAADVKQALLGGRIISASVAQPGFDIWPGRAMGVIEAPAERVYAMLIDLARYDQFVPRLRKSTALGGDVFAMRATLPWPLDDATAKVKLYKGKRGDVYVTTWKMLEGSLEYYEGSAWIQPWGKDRCILTYQMLAVPRIPAPAALMSRGLKNAVEMVVAAMRTRMTKLAKQ